MAEGTPTSPAVEIARLIDEAAKNGGTLSEEALAKIVQELTALFSVKADEVAIFQLSPESTVLSFIYPLKLRQVGTIPMTTTNSLAVRTAKDKRPEMINNFPASKHPTIFESVNLGEKGQERQPIQKIMSAPLLFEGKSVGVLQISRKGKTPMTAGPDFTIRDLTSLMTVSGLLAKAFKK